MFVTRWSYSVSTSAIAILLVLSGSTANAWEEGEHDEVYHVITAYREIERESQQMTPDLRSQMRQEWLTRLLAVIEGREETHNVQIARSDALSISNSLGNVALSQDLLQQMISSPFADIAEKARLYTQLGEILSVAYKQDRKPAKRDEAIAAFETANEIYRTEDERMPSAREATALNLYWMGDLLRDFRADRESLQKSVRCFREARDLLDEIGEPQHRLAGTGFDPEYALQRQAGASIRLDDVDGTVNALTEIAQLPNPRNSASFYLHLFATESGATNGESVREIIGDWIAESGEDEYTCVLKYVVAETFFYEKNYEVARPLYEELDSKYADGLLKLDGDAAIRGRGGRFATVLLHLRETYMHLGERRLASIANARFLQLYPNNGILTKHAKYYAKADQGRGVTKAKRTKALTVGSIPTNSARGWILVHIVIVAAIGVFIFFRRVRRSSQAT